MSKHDISWDKRDQREVKWKGYKDLGGHSLGQVNLPSVLISQRNIPHTLQRAMGQSYRGAT